MKKFLLTLSLLLLAVTSLAQVSFIRTYDSIEDLLANNNPQGSFRTVFVKSGPEGMGAIWVATNTVSGTNLSSRIYSGVDGWSWDKIEFDAASGLISSAVSGKLDATNGTAINLSATVLPDDALLTRNIKAQFADVVNARNYATGDGTTDDTAGLQEAIDIAIQKRRALYIPATSNYYKISTALIGGDNLTIYGDGPASKIVQTHVKLNALDFVSKTNILVRDIHLVANGNFDVDSNPGQAYCGMRFEDCSDFEVRTCTVTKSAYSSIYVTRGANFRILGNNFPDPGWVNPFVKQQQTGDIAIDDSHDGLVEGNNCFSIGQFAGAVGVGLNGGIKEALLGGAHGSGDCYNIVIRGNFIKRKTLYAVMAYNQGPPDNINLTNEIHDIIVERNIIRKIDGSYHHLADGTNYTGITEGTAAGTAIYMQSSFRSVVRDNDIKDCGIFTRAHGTHVKGGIGWGGTPDGLAINNNLERCWPGGIIFNNSAGQGGDLTNRAPKISGGHVINCAGYVALVTITNGSSTVYLADPVAPLEPAMVTNALGGFWIGDKVTIRGAGAASADLEAQVTGLDALAGTLTIDVTAGTTVQNTGMTMSELSDMPPSTRFAVGAIMIQRVEISGVNIQKDALFETGRSMGIYVQGAGGGSNSCFFPKIIGNPVRGGYYGVRLVNTTSAQITGNPLYGQVQAGISSDNNAIRSSIVANRVYNAGTGIKVNSLDGWVSLNYLECNIGIDSQGTEYLADNRVESCITPYNNQKPVRVLSAATSNPSVNGALYWVMNSPMTYTNFQDGRISEVHFMIASNAVTLTHNATSFIMRGGVDATLATGDTIALLRTSTNQWKELWRSSGDSANWAKDGATDSKLAGTARVNYIVSTNGFESSGSGLGILRLYNATKTQLISMGPDSGLSEDYHILWPAARFSGVAKWTMSGTNWVYSPAVEGTDIAKVSAAYTTLTDGATITITCVPKQDIQNAKVTLGGNRTLAFSGAANGMSGTLIVKQDATGGRTLTLPAGSIVVGSGSGAVTLTATANAIDVLSWTYDGTNFVWTRGLNAN